MPVLGQETRPIRLSCCQLSKWENIGHRNVKQQLNDIIPGDLVIAGVIRRNVDGEHRRHRHMEQKLDYIIPVDLTTAVNVTGDKINFLGFGCCAGCAGIGHNAGNIAGRLLRQLAVIPIMGLQFCCFTGCAGVAVGICINLYPITEIMGSRNALCFRMGTAYTGVGISTLRVTSRYLCDYTFIPTMW